MKANACAGIVKARAWAFESPHWLKLVQIEFRNLLRAHTLRIAQVFFSKALWFEAALLCNAGKTPSFHR